MIDKNKSIYVAQSFTFSKKGIDKRGKPVYNPRHGNISEDIVIKATFNNETIKKINFDNFDYNNIPSIADEWWNHQALNY